MSKVEELLALGRRSYQAGAWADAHASLLEADVLESLAIDDLERLALAAGLIGEDQVHVKVMERLHNACLQAGDGRRAARAGFWVGFRLIPLGERARAQAWFAKVQRVLDGIESIEGECVERGYLLLPLIIGKTAAGELDDAEALAEQAKGLAERCGDRDLLAFARSLLGCVLLRRAKVERGLALFDDAMLAVTTQEVSPVVGWLIYCHVIAGCSQVYALDRAREWTALLYAWCDAQPQLRAFAGACMVHRAELMELGGAWAESYQAACEATARAPAHSDPIALAGAAYQQAEIHRLRGEDSDAEARYAECVKLGREPLPGLALLRLAQGKAEAAANALRRVVAATSDRLQRTRYLPAHIEVMLAVGASDEARSACAELEATAGHYGGEVLQAIAMHARGAVLIADGNAQAAFEPLRGALVVWQRFGAPYIAARIHELLARVCAAAGDDDAARLEHAIARQAFEQLGATPDLARLDARHRAGDSGAPTKGSHGLSARELQVLRLVAAGKTNRAIAGELCLSEKTIDRHVSNIFGKLEVASRAAATAYAYEHDLI